MVRITVTGARLAPGEYLLAHQEETVAALRSFPVVVNTAPTGSGKTRAALSFLPEVRGDVLLIAPTNALVGQHEDAARRFVEEAGLRFDVLRISAPALDVFQEDSGGLRRGSVLERLLARPATDRPRFVVTNPDIFYAILMGRYHWLDQRGLFYRLVRQFSYVVVDEYHYYDAKQLLAFEFFLLLLKETGAFEAGRRFLFLTATPTRPFLETVEGLGIPYKIVGDGAHDVLEGVPFLAPLEVMFVASPPGGLPELADGPVGAQVVQWLSEGLDGVVISNSLRKITDVYLSLNRQGISREKIGRITGPVPERERRRTGGRSLVLATPTVDIGYNFEGRYKERQNVDFILTEAETQDQLLQRLGRAGRVLGKPVVDRTSRSIVVMPQDIYDALRAFDRQVLSRSELTTHVASVFPERNLHESYRLRYALVELSRPLFLLDRMTGADGRPRIQALFNRVKDLYCPGKGLSFGGLMQRQRELDDAQTFLKQRDVEKLPLRWVKDFLAEFNDVDRRALDQDFGDNRDLRKQLSRMDGRMVEWLAHYTAERWEELAGLYQFRGGFSGPSVNLYDPHSLLSEDLWTAYDLIHALRYYEVQRLSKEEAQGLSGEDSLPEPERPCLRLIRRREENARIAFVVSRRWEHRKHFESRLFRISGLSKLELRVAVGGGYVGVDDEIRALVREQVFPALVFEDSAETIYFSRESGFFTFDLTVEFPQEGTDAQYRAILGSQAYFAYAERFPYWKRCERQYWHNDFEPLIV